MLQPYIESATTLSDDDDEEIARNSLFCRAVERHFQRLSGPRNVNVDLKFDILCL